MGFFKKYKEKDKDRDRECKRDKDCKYWEKDDKDWDRDLDKERWYKEERSRYKWSYVIEDNVDRVEKKKSKREDYDDLFEYVVEELVCEDYSSYGI